MTTHTNIILYLVDNFNCNDFYFLSTLLPFYKFHLNWN